MRYYVVSLLLLQVLCGSHDLNASDFDTSSSDLDNILRCVVEPRIDSSRLKQQELRQERSWRIFQGVCCCCIATVMCCMKHDYPAEDHSASTKTEPLSKPLCLQVPPVMGARVETVKDKKDK